MPVIIALFVFILLALVFWKMEKEGFFAPTGSHPLCGHVLQQDLILTENVTCLADSLGTLPRETTEKFVLYTQTSGITLDCKGFSIQSEGGIGLFVEDAKDVRVQNCDFIGIERAISGRNADNLLIKDSLATVNLGGIEIIQSDGVKISGCTIGGANIESEWGMQFIGATKFSVTDSAVKDFRLSGINIYGSEHFDISNNIISTINDTGIGFFQREEFPATAHGKVSGNHFRWINTVGAFEVMHGAFDLVFEDNKIEKSKAAIYIYEKSGENKVRDIIFRNNKIDGTFIPITIHDGLNITIEGNLIEKSNGAGIFSVKDSQKITFVNNRFVLNNGPGTIENNVDHFTFSGNILENHFGSFLKIEIKPININLADNYWNGKPDIKDFSGITFPEDISPYRSEP